MAGIRWQPEHVLEDPSAANPDNCRPHLHTAGKRRRRVPRPVERHRQSGRTWFDAEEEPGLRDEVRDAGLQQAGQHTGSAAGGTRGDTDVADGHAAAALSHQSR